MLVSPDPGGTQYVTLVVPDGITVTFDAIHRNFVGTDPGSWNDDLTVGFASADGGPPTYGLETHNIDRRIGGLMYGTN